MDSDHEIVARTGVSIPTIFEIEGEAGFRRRECQIIEELTARHHIVMATGEVSCWRKETAHDSLETAWWPISMFHRANSTNGRGMTGIVRYFRWMTQAPADPAR